MLFVQNTAPIGWTFINTWNDKAIMITSVEADGGSTGGDWEISGLSMDSQGAHTHTTPAGDYVEKISHRASKPSWASDTYTVEDEDDSWDGNHIQVAGGDTLEGQHGHYIASMTTSENGAHTHNISHDGNWRPAYLLVICCEKD
ncbi:MAG: hypothetical protein DRG20_00920 [Deltaproteobacteria bacterium]|nr:MAG: hypothetical protein DRG20_00920 [Deltaproteobacteria bacterium]